MRHLTLETIRRGNGGDIGIKGFFSEGERIRRGAGILGRVGLAAGDWRFRSGLFWCSRGFRNAGGERPDERAAGEIELKREPERGFRIGSACRLGWRDTAPASGMPGTGLTLDAGWRRDWFSLSGKGERRQADTGELFWSAGGSVIAAHRGWRFEASGSRRTGRNRGDREPVDEWPLRASARVTFPAGNTELSGEVRTSWTWVPGRPARRGGRGGLSWKGPDWRFSLRIEREESLPGAAEWVGSVELHRTWRPVVRRGPP